jgi:hypothetical protein|nr:MAG TPA: hypothetical protein [Caudoviricetes sp.]
MKLASIILLVAAAAVWYAAITQQPFALTFGLSLGAAGTILGLISELKENDNEQ